MTSKLPLIVFAALLLCVTTACESETTPSTSSEPEEAVEAPEKGEPGRDERASEEAPEQAEAVDESEAPSDLPRGDAPDRAPLEAALAELEADADNTLFEGDSCEGFTDLEKCRRDENDEEWRTAARCYRNFVVVGGPDACRAAQFVKAAANFERDGSRQGAIASRMQVVEGAQTFNAAAIDAADYMIENGQIERARVFYDSYRTAHPDSALIDYVDQQCERVDGCAGQEHPQQQ
jgi:hypothetical protein